ncbi:MAG: hypothetical protein Q9167_005102 [Letrouitia subvulpina]
MAAESVINGSTSATSEDLSPAQRLQEKHAANAAHKSTVEDVVDEEDVMHPPPSMLIAPKNISAPVPDASPIPNSLSEKAMGKRKAQDEPPQASAKAQGSVTTMLDTKSEESFPTLGSGPKPQAPAPTAMVWGARKPFSVANAAPNGINGQAHLSSAASSRASTPASGRLTPASTNASISSQSRGSAIPQHVPMPGRHSERIQFAPSQLLPREQLKKPLQDVLRGINKRSKANVEMKLGPNSTIIFEGTGPVDATRQALRDVAREVGSKQSVKIPIPLSVRPHVIGRQGAVVQGITKRTGAKIQVPKADDSNFPDSDDDDSMTIDVAIEGDAVAAEMARREIEGIVNERTSTVNMRLRNIPQEFFPFIAGPYGSRIRMLEDGRQVNIHVPHYYSWTQQPPPQAPSPGTLPNFMPNPNIHIKISGERLAAQEARSEIERHVEELRRQITLSQLEINRGQHQFIVGDQGASLHDLLEETGCAVILPPDADDTELLTITGPSDKIDIGLDKVMNLASSMQMASVDIARQHTNAPLGSQAHAKALTRYLQQRQAIAQLEKMYDARIVLPATEDSSMSWEVYSRDGKNTIKARSNIMNLVNAHPPARLRHIEIDPFYHQHLHKQAAQHVRDQYGVHLLLPEEVNQSSQIVLIYEGAKPLAAQEYQLPKHRPSSAELMGFENSLRQAQDHLVGLIQGRQPICSRSMEIPSRFHDKVRKFVYRQQQDLPTSEFPVRLVSGSPNHILPPQQDQRPSSTAEHDISLRGPDDMVNDLAEKILDFLEREKQDELERGHITTFEFPQKFANYLIGRKGENINKYREEFDVDIQVNDGKIDIKGPKAKAELAKAKIVALAKKLEDEATHVLKIKSQYHKDMIGAKGAQVNRLQDRYNVRIQFPRSNPATSDDKSLADGASEAGMPRGSKATQAPDEVIIRGPRRGADEARDELLNLLQWTIDNSHISAVSVAQTQLPSLIGQGGREMENVRLATGAQIDVPGNRDTADSNGRVQIHIKGTKKQVEEAKTLLEQKAKHFDSTVTRSVEVEKKYHKALIGSGGTNIRAIVVEAGGSDDRRDLARTVRFPRPDSVENAIRIEGHRDVVEKILASIEKFVTLKESQTTQAVDIAPEKHRLLIGRGGETRRALESQFNVSIEIPKLSQQGSVNITGLPQDVETAKAHIFELIKEQEGETILVPRRIHHTISDSGQFFRRLRNDYKVTVDHAGQQPPAKYTSKSQSRINGGAVLPLITDDQRLPDSHSWEMVGNDLGKAEEGEIPWVIHGSAENVTKACKTLQRAIEQAQSQQQMFTGYLTLPDPHTYRFVIGHGGSQINSIRRQTGCRITVPRNQALGEAIEIVGSQDGVEHAKNIILDVIRDNGSIGRKE